METPATVHIARGSDPDAPARLLLNGHEVTSLVEFGFEAIGPTPRSLFGAPPYVVTISIEVPEITRDGDLPLTTLPLKPTTYPRVTPHCCAGDECPLRDA